MAHWSSSRSSRICLVLDAGSIVHRFWFIRSRETTMCTWWSRIFTFWLRYSSLMLDAPWTTSSMPYLFVNPDHLTSPSYGNEHSYNTFQSHIDCFMDASTTLDLSNPFNVIAAITPDPSVHSFKGLDEHQTEFRSDYFEPLPFLSAEDSRKQLIYPHLSEKHAIIKQSRACPSDFLSAIRSSDSSIVVISRKTRETLIARSHTSNHDGNRSSSLLHRPCRRLCTFCKSNGESAHVYTSHGEQRNEIADLLEQKNDCSLLVLRNIDNEVECPVLMAFICPKCGATGKSAHTIKYCTALSECERVALPTVKLLREGRSSSGNMNLFRQ